MNLKENGKGIMVRAIRSDVGRFATPLMAFVVEVLCPNYNQLSCSVMPRRESQFVCRWKVPFTMVLTALPSRTT